MAKLSDIEGIGVTFSKKLAAADITTTQALLKSGGTAKGRKELVKQTKLSDKLILKWVNRADLFRVKGIGEEYSDLLELGGVDSVPELAQRKAENLHEKLCEINAKKKAVRRTPGLKSVQSWIKEAKKLKRAVSH